jgi:hypothetical protein
MAQQLSYLQSLLQLSVGTNLTFAVVLSLFDETFIREKKIISSLHAGVLASKHINMSNFISEIESVNTKMINTSNKIDNLNHVYMRPLLLGCALLVFYSLVVSSYDPNGPISSLHFCIAYGSIIPFLFFCMYVLWRGYLITRAVRKINGKVDI